MAIIHVLGLGYGTKKGLTLGVYSLLKEVGHLYVRTANHPVVTELEAEGVAIRSFDAIYEGEETFQGVYEKIVAHLLEQAQKEGDIYYAVPGHPLVAEQTVKMLLDEAPSRGIEVKLEGGQSFLEPLFARLQVDPNEGCLILDGTALALEQLNPRLHQIITQVYDSFVASEVKLTLMELYPDDYPVTLVTAVGIEGEEEVLKLPLYELDRGFKTSNLACLYVPPAEEDRVLNRWYFHSRSLFRTLRGPEGCPWDKKQTHQSLRPYVLEEAQEVCQAIDEGDLFHLKEELGDLLLQVFLHAQIAEEEGIFTMEDVLESMNEKLIRRHPHVFGELKGKIKDEEELARLWREIKAKEKRDREQR